MVLLQQTSSIGSYWEGPQFQIKIQGLVQSWIRLKQLLSWTLDILPIKGQPHWILVGRNQSHRPVAAWMFIPWIHFLPFCWSKLPVVIVRRVLDNEAIDIETHWELILFSYVRCAHCFTLLTTKMAGNDIHDKCSRHNWSIAPIFLWAD